MVVISTNMKKSEVEGKGFTDINGAKAATEHPVSFCKISFRIFIYGAVNFANAKTTFPKSLYLCKAEEKYLSEFGRK